LLRKESESFHLRCRWDKTVLEVGVVRSGERTLSVNGNLERSGRDFIQYFYPVVFAPEDMEIICGIPTIRRRFFDMLACQLDPGYINVLHDYQRALKMRNLMLKNGKCDLDKLEIYEGLLAFAGADLSMRRQNCIKKFNTVLSTLAVNQTSRLSVDYRMQCSGGAEAYLEQFRRNRKREIEKRTTLTGCHLDDYIFLRNNELMRGFASNGQNRLAALHCKLASALLIMRCCGAEKLVVLADDVTGELDEANRQQFYKLLEPAGQLFFTFTELPKDEFFRDSNIIALPLS
jgi:DNA replication and repair protein RecF